MKICLTQVKDELDEVHGNGATSFKILGRPSSKLERSIKSKTFSPLAQ